MANINNVLQETKDNLKTLSEDLSSDNLPYFEFKDNNDIGRIINICSTASIVLDANLSPSEIVEKTIEQVSEYLTNPENSLLLNELDYIGKHFSVEIQSCFHTLKNSVKVVVDELFQDVSEKFQELVQREGGDILLEESNRTKLANTSKFEFLEWNGIGSSSAINNVLTIVKSICNLPNIEPNKMHFNIALNKIIRPQYKDTNLISNKETYQKNVEIVREYFATNYKYITEDDGKRFFDIVTNQTNYIAAFQTIKKELQSISTINQVIKKIIFDANNMLDFAEAIAKFVELDVSNEVKDQILTNCEALKESAYITLFGCLYYKENIFNDKLIITKELINYPVFQKAQKQGIDLDNIDGYLKAYYYKKELPLTGIPLDAVLTSDINSKLDEINAKIRMNKHVIFGKCLHNAFNYIVKNKFSYLCEHFGIDKSDKIKLQTLYNNYLRSADSLSKRLHGEIGKVEDILFDLIIHTFFDGTLIEMIYTYLGRSYEELLKINPKIEDEDLAFADAVAIINVILNFFKNNYIKKA